MYVVFVYCSEWCNISRWISFIISIQCEASLSYKNCCVADHSGGRRIKTGVNDVESTSLFVRPTCVPYQN